MDPVTAAALISAGSSIFGSVLGSRSTAQSTRDTNAANLAIAREQMAFQERMDNTKYQRGVADARAAGFNPLVAFPGSGGAPMGASAVMQNPNPNKGELFLATARAMTDIMKARADAKLADEMAKTEKTKQELNRANASGTFGIPGFMSVPLSTAANVLNSVRNIRRDSSTGGKPRNMDSKTIWNMIRSGPLGIGS